MQSEISYPKEVRPKFAGIPLSYGKPAPSVSPPHDFVGGASPSAKGMPVNFGRTLLLFLLLSAGSGVWAQDAADSPFPPRLEADLSAGASAIYLLDFDSASRHFEIGR